MIKVCPRCRSTWAGGRFCEDCGVQLDDPFGESATQLPDSVWSYIRLQYGARRGMLVRVIAILLAPVVAGLLLRSSVTLAAPMRYVAAFGSVAAGVAVWWTVHWIAGRAVRIWVLRRGRLQRRKLARAMLRRAFGTRPTAGGRAP
jgi:hypothetical protein